MKLLDVVVTAISLLVIAWLVVQVHQEVHRVRAEAQPIAACARLLAASRTSADTLYVYVNRGDCAR